MKKNFKISGHMLISLLMLLQITDNYAQVDSIQEPAPSARVEKKSTWSKIMADISAFFYKKKSQGHKKSIKAVVEQPAIQKPSLTMSREQAIEAIRGVTTNLFDPNDVNHITLHLNKMKEFAKFLDNIQDKKLIAAIHFLLANHHRSSITDIIFWTKAIKDLEIDIVIPMAPEILAKPKSEKLMLLHKKMTINN